MGRATAKAKNRWNAKNYDRVTVMLKKGEKERVREFAAAQGESMNGFIGRLIAEAMGLDGGEDFAGEEPGEEKPG